MMPQYKLQVLIVFAVNSKGFNFKSEHIIDIPLRETSSSGARLTLTIPMNNL